LGYVFVYGCLFVKTWRMWRIVENPQLKVIVIPQTDILIMVAVLLSIEITYLVIWSAVNTPIAKEVEDSTDSTTSHIICTGDNSNIWWGFFIVYKALFLLFGVYLTVATRKFATVLNDSKQVGLSIYVITLSLLVLIPISFALKDIPNAVFVLRTLGVCIPFMGVVIVLFVNSIARIFVSKKPPLCMSSRTSSLSSRITYVHNSSTITGDPTADTKINSVRHSSSGKPHSDSVSDRDSCPLRDPTEMPPKDDKKLSKELPSSLEATPNTGGENGDEEEDTDTIDLM